MLRRFKMNYNKVIVGGRLVADPEVKQGKKPFVVFTVAANGIDTEVNFIPCVTFDQTGELIAKHFKKGQEILVEGRLTSRRVEDKTYYSVAVERFEFVNKKEDTKAASKGDIPF